LFNSWVDLVFNPTFKKNFKLLPGDTLSFPDGFGNLYEIAYRDADSYLILVKIAGETKFTTIQGLVNRVHLAELYNSSPEIETLETLKNAVEAFEKCL
jgi:hypothetical protein